MTQCAPRDDGVLPATLGSLRSSDYYPLEVEHEGLRQSCAKATVFIIVSERIMREGIGGGAVRLVTKNVLDGVSDSKDEKYELVSMCLTTGLADVIMDPARSGTQQQAALAVITGVGVSK